MAVGSGRGQVWETLPYHGDMRAKVSVKPFKNSDIKKRGGGCSLGTTGTTGATGTTVTVTDSERGKNLFPVRFKIFRSHMDKK